MHAVAHVWNVTVACTSKVAARTRSCPTGRGDAGTLLALASELRPNPSSCPKPPLPPAAFRMNRARA
eukprot:310948-Pleurochrysis_carterae.AAC.2